MKEFNQSFEIDNAADPIVLPKFREFNSAKEMLQFVEEQGYLPEVIELIRGASIPFDAQARFELICRTLTFVFESKTPELTTAAILYLCNDYQFSFLSLRTIAEKYGVSHEHVRNIVAASCDALNLENQRKQEEAK